MKTRFSRNISALINRAWLPAAAVGFVAVNSAMANPSYWNDASGNWSVGANWLSTVAPRPYDTLYFINQSGGAYTPNNDFANGMPFDGIIFTNSSAPFTLGGNSILISGQTNNYNANIGITNTTSQAETVNNNLALDWGYYTFYSPAGSLALGGGITLDLGGVANFGPNNVTSASYTADGTGLIQGLGGAGLVGNNGLGSANSGGGFSALATVSGGAIVPYTYPSANIIAAAGPIGSTSPTVLSNLDITAITGNFSLAGGTANSYTVTNTTYLGTVLASINSTTKTTTLVIPSGNGVLDLGTNEGNMYIGGIYLPGGQTAQLITIGGGSGCVLTCGPMIAGNPIPGEIIIGINGNNTSNEGEINASIRDNLSGGAVSVVYAGGGSEYINVNSSYSGGTYMNKGRVQCNQTNALGVGPVYIAAGGAAISLQNTPAGVMPNNFFLSPACSFIGAATEGTLRMPGNNGGIMSGTFTLMGNPVTITNLQAGAPAIADRISVGSANVMTFLGGQITGPGTLEFYANAAGGTFGLSNATVNANNWTGGLVIDGANNDSSDLKLFANNQLGGNNVIPMAAGTGFGRLDLNGFSDTIGALNSISNSILNQVDDFGAAPSTLTIGANNASGSFYGTISDNGNANNLSIIKAGNGTQILSGNNSYVGNTFVNGGTLMLTNTANINSSASVSINGAMLDESQLLSSAGTNATFSLTNAIWKVAITSSGITNRATGTLNLGGSANTINITSLPIITGYPTTLHLISYTTLNAAVTNIVLGSIPVTSPATTGFVTNENGFIDLKLTGGPAPARFLSWNGTDSSNPTAWDVQQSVNWLNGVTPTTFDQNDFVSFNDSAAGQTNINVTTTVTVGSISISNTVKEYIFSGSGSISNSTAGQVALTKQGTNLLILDVNNQYTGGTFISNGIVQVGNGNNIGLSALGTGPVLNNGALAYDIGGGSINLVSNNISGTGGLTEEGADTLLVGGANSYTGNVLVTNNSVLQMGSYSALGSNPTITTVANGSTLDINGYTAYGFIVAQGSGVSGNGAINNSSTSIAGTQAPAAVEYVGLTNLTLTGDLTIGVTGSRFDLRAPGGTTGTPTAILSTGGHPYNIIKIGDGGLAGNAGFFGVVSAMVDTNLANIDIQNGTFEMEGNTTGLGNPTNAVIIEGNSAPNLGEFQLFQITNRLNKVIVLNDGGTLWNASGNNTIVGPVICTNSSGFSVQCNVNIAGGSLNLAGPLSGNGDIYQTIGTNILILSGDTTNFAGGADVHSGIMTISNVFWSVSGVTVESGTLLNVRGIIENSGVINSGTVTGSGVISNALDNFGIIEPGLASAPSTLAVGGTLTFESGSTATYNLNNANTVGGGINDLIAVNGNVIINGGTINILPVGLLQDGVAYTLITYTGSMSGGVGSLSCPSVDGYTFTLHDTGSAITVTATGGPSQWTGNSTTSSFWSDAANWSALPPPGSQILFQGNNRLNNTNDIAAGTSFGLIEFVPGSGAFVLNGNGINLSGSTVLNNAANTETINIPLTMTTPQTFNGAVGSLIIGGGLTNATSGNSATVFMGSGILTDAVGSTGTATNGIATSGNGTLWTMLDNPSSAPVSAPWYLNLTNGTFVFGSASSAPNFTSTSQQGQPTDNQLGYAAGSAATFIMSNGTYTTSARINTGPVGGSTGVVDVAGGTLTVASQFQGANGALTAGSWLIVSGGSFTTPGTIFVSSRGLGFLNVSGGSVSCGALDVSRNAANGGSGTVNLSGGSISCTSVASETANNGGSGTPTATFNFNGGTLIAKGSSATFYQGALSGPACPVNTFIFGGGANINDGGFSIGINESLQSGGANDGGLNKLGAGTVTLNKANTYNGPTTISAGTLALGATGSIASTAPITIAGGAKFNVSTLTLAAGQVLSNSTSTAGLVGNFNASSGVLNLTYAAGTPSLVVSNGTLTLAAGTVLNINNTSATPLPVGIYTIVSAGIGGSVAGTLPSTFTVSGGGTQGGQPVVLQISGGSLVLIVGSPASPAKFTGLTVDGATLTLSAINGAPNGTYRLLQSTNVLLPISQWTPVLTNSFDGSGNLNLTTNIVNPAVPQTFYLLLMP
ncbi:MAG TPA: autotransporter-associated beta strand repeat-containing protein [Pseudomonadales bacterium]|nr:autotransporter-associated beta strand repeat-containing protein [Pseudomonadales bacterium]